MALSLFFDVRTGARKRGCADAAVGGGLLSQPYKPEHNVLIPNILEGRLLLVLTSRYPTASHTMSVDQSRVPQPRLDDSETPKLCILEM